MDAILTTVIPALLPAVGDGFRSLIAKFTGTSAAAPKTVDEHIALMNADTDRLRAMAELDRPSGKASAWVTNLRESSRYIAVHIVIVNGVVQMLLNSDPVVVDLSFDLASSGFFFLFGDRVYRHLKRGK